MKRQWYMTAVGSDKEMTLVGEKLKDVVHDMDGAAVDVTLTPIPQADTDNYVDMDEMIRVFVKGDPHLMGSTCGCCALKRATVLRLRKQGFDV